MSSRVLKKLHGEPELELKEELELSDIDNENSTGAKKKQFNINRYDLFNEQSLSESEVKEDDNETEHASTATPYPIEQAKKKKKKRKKKSEKQSFSHRRSSEDNADLEDIARTAREVDKLFGETRISHSAVNAATNPVIKELLSVQHKNLNSSYEMKRMFGSKVIQAEQNKRRNIRGPRSLKSTWLVSAKESWPPVTKTGIYMSVEQMPDAKDPKATGSKNMCKSLIWFRYEHNASYRQLQQKFLTAVESMDSDNIIQIINQQPYHVDSLIQLSELCKMSEDHAMASELIEHAILALESAFHSMFSLTAGNCRLDYRRQENRAIFITLFKHAQYLEGRACSRTALEVAKLILSFDPENDQLAIILIIDYYALRAAQYQWLIQLYNEWQYSNNLSQLPNMAYSYALALFYCHGDDTLLADNALQYALTMFPGVLKPLLNELSVNTDSRVTRHPYFGPTAYSSQPPALQQLTALYTTRSKIVWQDAAILPWLEKNVNIVLDKVDKKDECIQEYSIKRTQRYKAPPKAILRHIVLSDFKEKVPLAPFINKDTEPILMYDPLPPIDSINIYTRPNMTSASRVLLDSSPFSMFFQSLLPTFNIQNVPIVNNDNRADGEEAAAAAVGDANVAVPAELPPDMEDGASVQNIQSFVELRNSLNSIVDAMRDFLTNIRVPERPNDADIDENESSEDEPNDYLT